MASKDFTVLKFEACKLQRTGSDVKECQELELPEFEFQQWTHFCVTFEKLEPSGVGGNVTTRIITYMDGYATAHC